jgi:hypothetical protein
MGRSGDIGSRFRALLSPDACDTNPGQPGRRIKGRGKIQSVPIKQEPTTCRPNSKCHGQSGWISDGRQGESVSRFNGVSGLRFRARPARNFSRLTAGLDENRRNI